MSSKGNPHTNVDGILAYGQRQVNRIVSPPTRQKIYDATANFAQERPLAFAFIVSQSIFSLLPLMLFVSFATSTAVFAFVCALVFSLFWVGVATLLLVPTLLVTFSIAVLVWVWAVATFLVARRLYRVLPASVRGDVAIRLPGTTNQQRQVVFQKKKNNGIAPVDGAEEPNGNNGSPKNYSRHTKAGDGEGFSFGDVEVKTEATEVDH
ncbi:hypothetical protein PG989_007494 [Apiospora arundinis]